MTIEASGKIKAGAKIQYLRTLVRVEVLYKFDTLSSEVGIDIPVNLMSIILGLGTYFTLLMRFQRKRMRCTAE